MGASVRHGAFVTQGLLKIRILTAWRGHLLDKSYRLLGHLRYMNAQT